VIIKKKNKRGLVTPVSGSPEVDQGLTKKVLEYESSIECSQATTVSQGYGKNNQKRINQLPTVKNYQSRTKNNHTRQSSLRSWHNSVRREVVVLFLAQRKRVRL
jgi:DNA-directed RNA polymerase